MGTSGVHTYEEIVNQPKAWKQALEVTDSLGGAITDLWLDNPEKQVLLTGCGSTYYLSLAAASLIRALTGRSAYGVPAGDLFLYPDTTYAHQKPTIMVAISRSGTTSETLAAVRHFQATQEGPVVVITNDGESPLAKRGDLTLAIPAGQERSIAQTRSFASMYVAVTALAVRIAGRGDWLKAMSALPDLGEELIKACHSQVKSLGERLDMDRFYFLGSGSRYGLAAEANLKMKEMTLTHSEPFHFLEFRHGPMSMVGKQAAIIGLRSTKNKAYEQNVLEEMASLGGNVFILDESDADLNFNSGLPEAVRNILYLPPLQLMAFYRSIIKGLNPDKPHNLEAVVRIDI